MGSLVNRYETKFLNSLTGVVPFTTPSDVYLALFESDPTEAGLVSSELTGDGYSRTALAAFYSTETGDTAYNTSTINSSLATADWPLISYIAVMEASTVGIEDMMYYVKLETPILVYDGFTFTFEIGMLKVAVY